MKTAIRFTALLLGLSMLMPAVSFAETATSTVDMITQLKQRILELQVQILELQKQQEQVTLELLKTLQQGSTGDDVKTLQTLLAGDSDIYPEGKITGFFGPLTAKAIKKFQKKHGFEQVGFVGPKTLKKLNELLRESTVVIVGGDSQNLTASTTCTVLPPGHYIAPGWNKKMWHDDDDDEDDDNDDGDDNDSDDHKKKNKHKEFKFGSIPFSIPCNQLPPGIAKKIGQGTTTPPVLDTTAPVIVSTSVSDIGTTTARINWTTNELTRTQIAYGTSTSYTTETGWSAGANTTHTHFITGLTANIAYHFQITVKDAAANTASSGDMTFTTASPPPADTTAPVISSISIGNLASTTADVVWTTNEVATSKVYYGTTTPLSLSGASFIADSSLVTSHTKTLSGLTASTTHYYVIESQDGVGNTATSTENSFTTLP